MAATANNPSKCINILHENWFFITNVVFSVFQIPFHGPVLQLNWFTGFSFGSVSKLLGKSTIILKNRKEKICFWQHLSNDTSGRLTIRWLNLEQVKWLKVSAVALYVSAISCCVWKHYQHQVCYFWTKSGSSWWELFNHNFQYWNLVWFFNIFFKEIKQVIHCHVRIRKMLWFWCFRSFRLLGLDSIGRTYFLWSGMRPHDVIKFCLVNFETYSS